MAAGTFMERRLTRRDKKAIKEQAREALRRLDSTLDRTLVALRAGFEPDALERELAGDDSAHGEPAQPGR